MLKRMESEKRIAYNLNERRQDVAGQRKHVEKQETRHGSEIFLYRKKTTTHSWNIFRSTFDVQAALLNASAIPPIATDVSAMIRPSVCLSHSCTLLKPVDGMRRHLVGTLVRSQLPKYNSVLDRGGPPRGDLGVGTRPLSIAVPNYTTHCTLRRN